MVSPNAEYTPGPAPPSSERRQRNILALRRGELVRKVAWVIGAVVLLVGVGGAVLWRLWQLEALSRELFHAVDRGDAALATRLLDQGANPHARHRTGHFSAVWYAAQHPSGAVLKVLLRRGADPDEAGGDSTPPLVRAAAMGYLDIVQILLAGGADVDVRDVEGYTALHMATSNEHVAIVQALLDAGALLDRRNDRHESPLDLIRRRLPMTGGVTPKSSVTARRVLRRQRERRQRILALLTAAEQEHTSRGPERAGPLKPEDPAGPETPVAPAPKLPTSVPGSHPGAHDSDPAGGQRTRLPPD